MNAPMGWLAAATDLLFPRNCPFCPKTLDEKQPGVICSSCQDQVRFIEPPFCGRCGLPFAGEPAEIYRCGHCHGRQFAFERAISACTAEGPVREAIHRFKYDRQMYFVDHLVDWIVGAGWRWVDWAGVDLVVPVPLHPRKRRAREFNQALILARAVGKTMSRSVVPRALRRILDTQSQTRLTAGERARNLAAAFVPGRDGKVVAGKRVVLVDDVFTTGATLDNCAKVLRDSGAETIIALTVARGV